MEKNLNLFPQFLVRYPDNGIKNEEDKPISISEDDFELSLFAIDSLLHVMNISLPIQQSPEAVIEFTQNFFNPGDWPQDEPKPYILLRVQMIGLKLVINLLTKCAII